MLKAGKKKLLKEIIALQPPPNQSTDAMQHRYNYQ